MTLTVQCVVYVGRPSTICSTVHKVLLLFCVIELYALTTRKMLHSIRRFTLTFTVVFAISNSVYVVANVVLSFTLSLTSKVNSQTGIYGNSQFFLLKINELLGKPFEVFSIEYKEKAKIHKFFGHQRIFSAIECYVAI